MRQDNIDQIVEKSENNIVVRDDNSEKPFSTEKYGWKIEDGDYFHNRHTKTKVRKEERLGLSLKLVLKIGLFAIIIISVWLLLPYVSLF